MLTVDDYGAIRRARRDGMSIRQIARDLSSLPAEDPSGPRSIPSPIPTPGPATDPPRCWGRSRRSSTRSWPTTSTPRPSSGTPPCRCSAASATSTATPAVTPRCNAICVEHRRRHQETFIPLGHLPGRRLEADFGHIHVDFPDGRRLVPFLVTTWAYSNAPFVLALPFERTEAILEGMVAAFEFFGVVPREVWWDNPKTVATLILQGRERQLHPRYAALASHYVFDPRFCMPARGNEKPDAEGTVKAVQRRFATPVPRVADLDELNTFFRKRCEAERERVVQSLFGPFTIKDRLAEDLAAAAPLPGAPVRPLRDPPRGRGRQVPDRRLRHQPLQRAAAVRVPDGDGQGLRRPVVIVAQGQAVATHARSPAAADDGPRPAPLPGDAGPQARRAGPRAGLPRLEAPRVLRRLPRRPGTTARRGGRRTPVRAGLATAGRAPPDACPSRPSKSAGREHLISAEAVIQRTRSLAAIEATTARPPPSPPDASAAASGPRAAARPEPLRPAPGRSASDESSDDPLNISCRDHAPEVPVSVFFA